jgi:hypothetical protein
VLGATPIASSPSYQALEAYCRLVFSLAPEDTRDELARLLCVAHMPAQIVETREVPHGSA